MSKMVQIRNMPDQLHRTLKSRAAREGMSLSDYIKRELANVAERPTQQEWLERIRQSKPVPIRGNVVDVIRKMRDSR